MVTHNTDAREVVEAKRGTAALYDLVFGDAFNDYQIPYHLTTREFAQSLRNLLKPDGLYLVLVIDRMRGGRFMASLVRTRREVFPHVYVLSDLARTMAVRAQTYVVAASATPPDLDRLRSVPGREPDGGTAVRIMPADAMEDWLRGRPRSCSPTTTRRPTTSWRRSSSTATSDGPPPASRPDCGAW